VKRIHIKPVAGRRALDPVSKQPVKEGGERKPASSYWLRRLADGDVELVDAVDAGKETP
jgi:hypothetical protein